MNAPRLHSTPRSPRAIALLLALGVALAGCAGSKGPARAPSAAAEGAGASLGAFEDRGADFHYLVGRQFELDGRDEEAIAAYRAALESDPDSALIHHKLSQLLAHSSFPRNSFDQLWALRQRTSDCVCQGGAAVLL